MNKKVTGRWLGLGRTDEECRDVCQVKHLWDCPRFFPSLGDLVKANWERHWTGAVRGLEPETWPLPLKSMGQKAR